MTPRSPGTRPTAAGARAVLAAAAEVEAAEARIKQAVLDAARARDCARVIEIMERWLSMPAAEVLADSPCNMRPSGGK